MEKWILMGMAPVFLGLIAWEAWYWRRRDPGKYSLLDTFSNAGLALMHQVADAIAWSVVMSDDLSGNWEDELDQAALIKALGEERAAALMPLYPDNRPVIVPSAAPAATSQGAPGGAAAIDWARVSTTLVGSVPPDTFGLGAGDYVGSNNWVIAGDHTDTGKPLLADDQLALGHRVSVAGQAAPEAS